MSAVCPACGSTDVVEVDNPMRREVRHRRGVPCPGSAAAAAPVLPDIVVDPALDPNVIQFVNLDGSLAGQLRMDDDTVTVRIPHPPVTPEAAVLAASRVVAPLGYLVLVRNRGRRTGPWTAGWDEAVRLALGRLDSSGPRNATGVLPAQAIGYLGRRSTTRRAGAGRAAPEKSASLPSHESTGRHDKYGQLISWARRDAPAEAKRRSAQTPATRVASPPRAGLAATASPADRSRDTDE